MSGQNRGGLQKPSTYQKLIEDMANEIARAKRYVKPLSILMISLSNLHDNNGPRKGGAKSDPEMETINLFTRNVRVIDRVYLYDEGIWVILLPETDKVEALSTAKRLQKIVQRKPAGFGANNHYYEKTAIYIGMACYPWDGNSQQELLKAAHSALCEAKQFGRSRICFLDFDYQQVRSGSQPAYKIRSV